MRRQRIDWSKITINDNFMFITVFSDPELCRELLERVLDKDILRVEIIQSERTLVPEISSKGIRMDVYLNDEAGTVYDVEMQNAEKGGLERRSRYYLSANDLDCIDRGEDYREMRDSYVIFICCFDPFRRGLVRYTITPHCREDDVEMIDGATRLFVNAPAYDQCEDERLLVLLRYLSGGTIGDDFTKRVDDAVRRERDRPEWRRNRMKLSRMLDERYAEGRAEGRAEGLAEGRAELYGAYSRLATALREAGREDELYAALTDTETLDRLLTEFGIELAAED